MNKSPAWGKNFLVLNALFAFCNRSIHAAPVFDSDLVVSPFSELLAIALHEVLRTSPPVLLASVSRRSTANGCSKANMLIKILLNVCCGNCRNLARDIADQYRVGLGSSMLQRWIIINIKLSHTVAKIGCNEMKGNTLQIQGSSFLFSFL